MYVVSGCPRSGTSLTMDIMRIALGEDRIIGEKFPQEKRNKEPETEVEKYLSEKFPNNQKEQFEKSKDMNPNGFWEMEWSVKGIRYLPNLHTELQSSKISPIKVVKCVSQGLIVSDPIHISKIIFLLRHPRQVAKSQEKLQGQFGDLENPIQNGREVRKHSPQMFCQVTIQAARWFDLNPEVPLLIVNFDDCSSV